MKLFTFTLTKLLIVSIYVFYCTMFNNLDKINSTNTQTSSKSKSSSTTTSKTEMDAFIKMKDMMLNHHKSNEKIKENIKMSNNQDNGDIMNFMSFLSTKTTKTTGNIRKEDNSKVSSSVEDFHSKYNFKSQEKTKEFSQIKNLISSASNIKDHKELDESENNNHKEPGDQYDNWFTIYSREFKDYSRHPALKLPNGTVIEIGVNNRNMRVNNAFNCTDSEKPPSLFHFYFRMNNINMYYASTKKDLNVLGAIDWDDVVDVVETTKSYNKTNYYCFQTNDKLNKNWILCHEKHETQHKWFCRIKSILKMPEDPTCADVLGGVPVKSEEITKIQPEVIIPLPSRQCNENWSYKDNGKDWECICSEGVEQSPIDLPPPYIAIDSPVKPLFEYSEVGPQHDVSTLDSFVTAGNNISIKNTDGHLSILHSNLGKIVTLDGVVYTAEEITFHTPSNHKIHGKQYPLEISIIHYGITKGDIAKQVVLSFLFEKKAGVYNQFIDDVGMFSLPNPVTKIRDIDNPLFIPKILYEFHGENDDQTILMKPFSFYTYQGSLPFPPCTERTINFVSSEPLRIGSTALQLFKEALRVPDIIERTGNSFNVRVSDKLPVSNRETQPTNGRPIFHYDHKKYCPMSPPKTDAKPIGHYEKMKRDVTSYFYVSGNKPSGIPGSFVVPDEEAGH